MIAAGLSFSRKLRELDDGSLELGSVKMMHLRAEPGEECQARQQGHNQKENKSRPEAWLKKGHSS